MATFLSRRERASAGGCSSICIYEYVIEGGEIERGKRRREKENGMERERKGKGERKKREEREGKKREGKEGKRRKGEGKRRKREEVRSGKMGSEG